MAPSTSDDFDGYRKWLGITNKNRLPTHYEVLAISLDEDDPEVIRAAVEQRRHYVESKRGEGHDAIVTEITYRINEAETTLLNDEMRREYDRQLNLFEKRHKNRQVDPLAPRSRIKSLPGRTVGEDSGIVKTFVGIMAVVCVGFGIMAWFSFQLPWAKKPAQEPESVPVAQNGVPVVVAAPAQLTPNLEHPKPETSQPPAAALNEHVAVVPSVSPVKPVVSPKSPDPHRLLSGHTADVNLLAISSDGKFIASASHDHTVRLWEFETGKKVWRTAWGNTNFQALAFEANGKRLWAANGDGACSIETESGVAKDVLKFKSGVAVFGKNCSLIAISDDGKMRLFDTSRRKQTKVQDGWASALTFNRDATILAIGGWEDQGDIRLYRPAEGKVNGVYAGLKDRTFALKISPDDKYLAATSGCGKNKQVAPSNKIIVWEAATGRTVMEHPHVDGWCYGLAVSMDSRLVAAGGSGRDSDWGGGSTPNKNKVRVWRINDGKEVHALTGHTAAIQSLVFTPDANSIVSSGADQTIRIWPLNSSSSSPDREVAEWVLAKGGKVKISLNGGEPSEIQAKGQLPSGNVNVVEVDLKDLRIFGDQDMRRLIDLRRLTVLTVMGTSVTDAGLRELADVTTLTSLNVAGTSITGSGFQHLSKLDKLETLLCGGAPITDANLVHLKKLPKLKEIGLIDTQVTDVGMPTIAALEQLKTLRLDGCNVTDKA